MKMNYATLLFVKRVKENSSSGQRTIIYMHCKAKGNPTYKAKGILVSKPVLKKSVSICFQVVGMTLGRYIKETNKLLQNLQKGE